MDNIKGKIMTTKLTRNDPVVFHFRVKEEDGLSSRGGATVVFSPKAERFGVSVCSLKDAYSRKRGRQIATGRALSKNSFCPFASSQDITMELIREHAIELAQEEAASVIGSEATHSWKNNERT